MLKRLRFSLKFRKTASGWHFRFAVEYLSRRVPDLKVGESGLRSGFLPS